MFERLEERRLLAVDDYGLVPQGSASATPQADVPTYVLVHGWNGSPGASWGFGTIGAAVENRIGNGAQVYAFDWSEAAGTGGDFFTAEARIPAAAAGLADLLSGINASRINLIGHSFGAYVAFEAAAALGNIATITALDGGTDVPFGYDATGRVNYRNVANQSWSLYASGLGNAQIATTADHAVTARWANGDTSDGLRHNHVIQMFYSAVLGDYAHIPSFNVAYLADGVLPDVQGDRFGSNGALGGSFDAVLDVSLNSTVPYANEFVTGDTRKVDVFKPNSFNTSNARTGMLVNADPANGTLSVDRAGTVATFDFAGSYGGEVNIHGSNSGDYIDARDSATNVNIYGMDADDILVGTEFDDGIFGGRDRDSIHGLGGNDFLAGQSHADKIFGGLGDDVLSGKTGNDYLRGEAGNDKLYGDQGSDFLRGHTGNDILEGGSSNDKLYGDEGDDTLIGGAGRDYLRGFLGIDTADRDDTDFVVEDIEELL